jgi:hypothetical protein
MTELNTEKIDKLPVDTEFPVDEKLPVRDGTPSIIAPTPGKSSPIELDDTSDDAATPTSYRPAHIDENGNFVERSPAELRKLMRRIDLRIIPWTSLLSWLSYLDIGLLSKARLFGLEKDLGMVGTDFNTLALMPSIANICFELPSNLIVARVRPSLFFPGNISSLFFKQG